MNDAEEKVVPLTPVIVAPADATVDVVQGFARCSAPFENVDETAHVTPVSRNVHGESAAAAVPARTSAATATAPDQTVSEPGPGCGNPDVGDGITGAGVPAPPDLSSVTVTSPPDVRTTIGP